MSIDAFGTKEQLLKLKIRILMAEKQRLERQPAISFEDVKKRLEAKFNEGI